MCLNLPEYHRGQNHYKTPLYKIVVRGKSYFVISTNALHLARKRLQTYYTNHSVRKLFCNDFGQDGTGVAAGPHLGRRLIGWESKDMWHGGVLQRRCSLLSP